MSETNSNRREDIRFDADGTELAGWLYRPAGPRPWPTVVMAHGFSAVKELYLDAYAQVFAAAGLAVLVFDHRNFGGHALMVADFDRSSDAARTFFASHL